MQYRKDEVSGNKLSILGLGCMRFPRSLADTEKMILSAIDGGVNYFDTAYIYPNSEETLGGILAKNKKREAIFLATKLPLLLCKGPDDFDKYFNRQLERLQTNYMDYYLMHNIADSAQWEKFCEWGVEKWIAEKKSAGKIRQIGFSFHGSRGEFMKVLDAYKWEFCQLQYNYSNETYQAGREGVEAAAAKGIPVIIMEPLLGGKLATGLPKEALALFAKAAIKTDVTNETTVTSATGVRELSPAAWGLRWVWNHSETTCVLSGMSSAAQLADNLEAAEHAPLSSLSEADLAVYAQVVAIFNKAYKVQCTGCNYCMPCPKGVNIPGCFAAYNASYAQNWATGMQQFFTSTASVSKQPHGPRLCVNCGKCENHCPQHLPIRKALKQVAARLEPLPIHLGLSIARRFLG
jgi:predicted aldo/keto reductase-like oxidoreductase